jgi:hypothetical protein
MSTSSLDTTYRALLKRPRPERIRLLPRVFLRHYRVARRYAGPVTAWHIARNMTANLAKQWPGELPGFWRYLPPIGSILDWWQFYATAWRTEGYFGKIIVILLLAAIVTLVATLCWFVAVAL